MGRHNSVVRYVIGIDHGCSVSAMHRSVFYPGIHSTVNFNGTDKRHQNIPETSQSEFLGLFSGQARMLC